MKTTQTLFSAIVLLAFIPSCNKQSCYYCIQSNQYYCVANGAVQASYSSDSAANVTQCSQLYGGTLVLNGNSNGNNTPYCFTTSGLDAGSEKALENNEGTSCQQSGGRWVPQ